MTDKMASGFFVGRLQRHLNALFPSMTELAVADRL
jgi:hypothetical protein